MIHTKNNQKKIIENENLMVRINIFYKKNQNNIQNLNIH